MFDHLHTHLIRWPHKQPDLNNVIRLFLEAIPLWLYRFIDLRKHLQVYYVKQNRAVLGANQKNLEFRVIFFNTEEFPGGLVLFFAVSHLNLIGYLQSFILRLVYLLIMTHILRSVRKQPQLSA